MTLRAVLWDLDGTLTDSVRFVVDTANRVIETHGGSALAFDSVGAMTGLPLEEIFFLALLCYVTMNTFAGARLLLRRRRA